MKFVRYTLHFFASNPCLEQTLALIKPDAYGAGKKDEIISKIVHEGFKIAREKEIQMTVDMAKEFYKEHDGKPFYETLYTWMSRYVYLWFNICSFLVVLLFTLWCLKRLEQSPNGGSWLAPLTRSRREKKLPTGNIYIIYLPICWNIPASAPFTERMAAKTLFTVLIHPQAPLEKLVFCSALKLLPMKLPESLMVRTQSEPKDTLPARAQARRMSQANPTTTPVPDKASPRPHLPGDLSLVLVPNCNKANNYSFLNTFPFCSQIIFL